MILKRYGNRLQSVRPNFDAHAMTEVGFLRDNDANYTAPEFEAEWERVGERELTASAEGHVQSLAEHAVLHSLEEQLLDLERDQTHGVLVVENEQGKDMPKTRHTQRVLVEEGENKLHFAFEIDPPLRVGIYRRKG